MWATYHGCSELNLIHFQRQLTFTSTKPFSNLLLCMCLTRCVGYGCVWKFGHVWACACGGQRSSLDVIPQGLSTLVLRQGLSLSQAFTDEGKLVGRSCSTISFLALRLEVCATMLGSFFWILRKYANKTCPCSLSILPRLKYSEEHTCRDGYNEVEVSFSQGPVPRPWCVIAEMFVLPLPAIFPLLCVLQELRGLWQPQLVSLLL